MRNSNRNHWLLLLLLVVGTVIGGLIGDIFKDSLGILGYSKTVGFEPVSINLIVLNLTLGLKLYLNVVSAIGMIVGIFIFTRL